MASVPVRKKSSGRPPSVPIYPGAIFGRLTIVRKAHLKEGLRWWVRCKCGKEFYTKSQYLTRKPNPQISCGCHVNEFANPYPETKMCWHTMHLRCYYEKHVAYKDYGGRGIYVCPEWHRDNPEGWQNFLRDMGPRPKPFKQWTVDRINPNGIYEKSNCKWATKKEQGQNQRRHYNADGTKKKVTT